jgi:hypothetical protein
VAVAHEAASSGFGSGVQRRLASAGEGWLAWVVAVDDVDAVARRLGTAVASIGREGFSARLTGVAEALQDPSLPFFVCRDPGVPDPGADGDAGGITWVEVVGDAERLERRLGATGLPVRIAAGPPALRAVGIGDRAVRGRPGP